MKKPRRRHRRSSGSQVSSVAEEPASSGVVRTNSKPNTSRELSNTASDSHGREPLKESNESTSAALDVIKAGAQSPPTIQAQGSGSTKAISVAESGTVKPQHKCPVSVKPAGSSTVGTPDVFSFLERSESPTVAAVATSPTVSTAYWQRQEWLRRQANLQQTSVIRTDIPTPAALPIGITSDRDGEGDLEKRDSPVSSDSGIGLDGDTPTTEKECREEAVEAKTSAAREAFAPLLRSMSQRSSKRPYTPSTTDSCPDTTSLVPRPRATVTSHSKPIVHHVPQPITPVPRYTAEDIFSTPKPWVHKGSRPKRKVSGYERLASKLSSFATSDECTTFVPVYRRFETLNQRLFLHLQDEIVEIEAELQRCDEADACTRAAIAHNAQRPSPESRRNLASGKFEILGRAYVKLGQYNQALLSYSKLIQRLEPAKKDNIQSLRHWIQSQAEIFPGEIQFLTHEEDLLSIQRQPSETSPRTRLEQQGGENTTPADKHISATLMIASGFLLPIIAFGFISSLYWRLFGIVAIAWLSTLKSSKDGTTTDPPEQRFHLML
ncbi:MAG: hypothetical protein M1814_006058 [Vezdaea aestivalis]|nr:MAG: hypothetical protein M1814_006058 [Vezdaea aestivalis]